MDISDFTPRLGKALGLTHEPISYGIPGSIFMFLWGAGPYGSLRALLATDALGKGTFADGLKVVLLLILAFAVGFSLTLAGDITARGIGWLLSQARKLLRRPHNSVKGLLEFEITLQAFKEHFPEVWKEAEKAKGDQAVEHVHSIVLTLLVYYTTRFRDLEENWRRWVRNSNLISGMAAALLLAAILPHGTPGFSPELAALLGAIALALGIRELGVGKRYAARIITAGYLREKRLPPPNGS